MYVFTNSGFGGLGPNALAIDAAGNLFGTTSVGGSRTQNAGVVFELTHLAGGWSENILYTFQGGSDGATPFGPVTIDSAGNLYGTTYYGGGANACGFGCGTVFKLTRNGSNWTKNTLYSLSGSDGQRPSGSLVLDASGGLEGIATACGLGTVGAVYELAPSSTGSWQETQLYPFPGTDGEYVQGGLVSDNAGGFFGTAGQGGAFNYGTVYHLAHSSSGTWQATTLYEFTGENGDAASPAASMILDSAGNLYGTTWRGGAYGYGAVFELSPQADGSWKESVLHSFNANSGDGARPLASLVLDKAGNLYGTTDGGGLTRCGDGCGIVFELSPSTSGQWTETIVHKFANYGDGAGPAAALMIDKSGNLFGTNSAIATGVAFEISPSASGWTFRVLHIFSAGSDGCPMAGIIEDEAGNLYGTTEGCGQNGGGSVYQLSPSPNGQWTENVIYSFSLSGTGGNEPEAELAFDAAGNLYGTTFGGGTYSPFCAGYNPLTLLPYCGTVFELVHNSDGTWAYEELYAFAGPLTDGGNPTSAVIVDSAGRLYGTTTIGGPDYGDGGNLNSGGTVFEIAP